MDVSHLALFTQLPPGAQQSLLSSARRVLLRKNDVVFASSQSTITSGSDDHTQSQQRSSSRITSLAVVVCGRLDLCWTGEAPPAAAAAPATDGRKSASAADDAAKTLFKSPLVSIRRGQSIGEQTLGLSLDTHSPSVVLQQPPATPGTTAVTQRVLPPQQFANELPVRIVAGDDNTELLLISRQLYEDKRQEFQITQSYVAAMRSLALSTDTVAPHRRSLVGEPVVATSSIVSPFERWAPSFFAKKPPRERDVHDICELAWRLRTDRILGKAFFQFPPLVLERLCTRWS
ncbi:hypothetical protein PINS_up006234 [Pythium insidiosum]|nr:hypothetical protein PINS_up006234 [Pythium insidiosum]